MSNTDIIVNHRNFNKKVYWYCTTTVNKFKVKKTVIYITEDVFFVLCRIDKKGKED